MLQLSDKFNLDTQSKNTSITPLIVIDNDIYISTVKGLFDNDIFWEDRGLKISTLNDTIDLSSKKLQINKFSFTLSNFPINGERFSDLVYEKGLVNKEVKAFYKTQSCSSIDDCLQIFEGRIKRFSHDSGQVKIEVEDLTEGKLKKEVPISTTGFGSNVYSDKYKNVPIPIVYGEVDRAPAIPFIDKNDNTEDVNIKIVTDAIANVVDSDREIEIMGYTSIKNIDSQEDNPLYIYKDDYYQVLQEFNSEVLTDPEDFDVGNPEQYLINGSHIEIRKIFTGIIPHNAPAFNELQCIKSVSPNQFLVSPNLTGLDLELQEDDAGNPFINQPLTIQAPELAIDTDTGFSTYASVPDNTVEIDPNEPIRYEGFRTFNSEVEGIYGYFMPQSGASPWGGTVFQWLNSYMHILNTDEDNPTVVYKQFPTDAGIKKRLREVLEAEFGVSGSFFTTPYSNQPHFMTHFNNYRSSIGLPSDTPDLSEYSTNINWFVDNANGGALPSPQPFFISRGISSAYVDIFGFNEVWVTMNNGTMQPSGNNRRMYNLFNLDDGFPYLFESEEFDEFVPTDISVSHTNSRMHFKSFRGKMIHETTNNSYFNNGTDGSADAEWFGTYCFHHAGWNRMRTREGDMFKNKNSSWVIWAKRDIENVGETLEDLSDYGWTFGQSPFDGAGYNHINGSMKINANTIYPCTHRGHRDSNNGSSYGWVIHFGNKGVPLNVNPHFFTINDYISTEEIADTRASFLFPFNDLDISDNIYSNTFFKGKIKCFFDQENTAASSSADFILHVAPVDKGELNYEILDGNDYTAKLIQESFNTCRSADQWWSTDPSEQDSSENSYSSEYDGSLDIFFENDVSTFSTINLTYRVQSVGWFDYLRATLRTEIFDVGMTHYIIFEKALDSDFYIDTIGRAKIELDENGNEFKSLVEHPSDIIAHFLEHELLIDKDNINENSLNKSKDVHGADKYAFSLKELKSSKEVIEEISENSRIIPKFNPNSDFSFYYIKDTYGEDDVDFTINVADIVSYELSRTPIEKISTLVNVKFRKEYADDEYLEETGYVDGYDMFGNGDGTDILEGRENGYSYNYLGLDREDKVLDFESGYIRDMNTAINLRNYLYMFNCNQHNIFKLKLPISKYVSLETGDIIKFDGLMENMRAYGEDYTTEVVRNAQTIYPYFMVTRVSRKVNGMELDCIQLHDLTPFKFTPATGSLTRLLADGESAYRNQADYNILENYLFGGEKYFTSEQKRISFINDDTIIDDKDLEALFLMLTPDFGDLNADGVVNVVDIITLINQIVSGDVNYEAADLNQDGVVNVIDIINLVNQVMGDTNE